jgi:DNA-binding NarL/FixJ family response regulator
MPVRVAIFEDNKLIRDALTLLVQATPGLDCAGAFPDCSGLVAHMEAARPDVVLMDIEMPGMNGVEGVRLLKARFPQITVIMQTVFEDDDKVFDAICAGASGYLLKDTPPARIMESILEAHGGGSPMSPSIARKTLGLFQHFLAPYSRSREADYALTQREKEVLHHLVDGCSYKMIADQCGISFDTVRTHIRNIYKKLHVASSAEAVAKALRERLI